MVCLCLSEVQSSSQHRNLTCSCCPKNGIKCATLEERYQTGLVLIYQMDNSSHMLMMSPLHRVALVSTVGVSVSLSLSVLQVVIGVTGFTWDSPSPTVSRLDFLAACYADSLCYVLPFPCQFLPTIGNSLQLIGDKCFARFGALVVNNYHVSFGSTLVCSCCSQELNCDSVPQKILFSSME